MPLDLSGVDRIIANLRDPKNNPLPSNDINNPAKQPIPQSDHQFDEFEPVDFKNYKPIKIEPNMTRQEIERVIDQYLREILSFIPAINEEFDIQKNFQLLKKTKKENRKNALEIFKRNMNSQIEGMACCKMIIQGLIDDNPNIPEEVLKNIIEKFSIKFGVKKGTLEIYLRTLKHFCARREQIIEIRKKYPDDIDLINKLQGIKQFSKFQLFKPSLKIETTPYGFVIFIKRRDAERITPQANNLSGFSGLVEIDGKNIQIAVVLTDKTGGFELDDIKRHEFEHTKEENFNFMNQLVQSTPSPYSRSLPESKTPYSFIPYTLDVYVMSSARKFQRGTVFDQNEILLYFEAYCKNESKFVLNNILRGETLSRKKDIKEDDFEKIIFSYTYETFSKIDSLVQTILKIKEIPSSIKEKIVSTLEKYKRKVREDVIRAQAAFDKLQTVGGYSTDEAISLMSYTPIELWDKKIQRLLINKPSR